ncbi:hypothetical protein OIU78_025029 [Salix suchowensis]|nr:hypothetical protein OIU78_025029 [Salix suchowensis]
MYIESIKSIGRNTAKRNPSVNGLILTKLFRGLKKEIQRFFPNYGPRAFSIQNGHERPCIHSKTPPRQTLGKEGIFRFLLKIIIIMTVACPSSFFDVVGPCSSFNQRLTLVWSWER